MRRLGINSDLLKGVSGADECTRCIFSPNIFFVLRRLKRKGKRLSEVCRNSSCDWKWIRDILSVKGCTEDCWNNMVFVFIELLVDHTPSAWVGTHGMGKVSVMRTPARET